jgi:hypothetical protein
MQSQQKRRFSQSWPIEVWFVYFSGILLTTPMTITDF